MTSNQIEFEHSSGNVFADLGFDDAEALQTRGMIGIHVVQLIKERNLKQYEIADLLGIQQAEVSHLMNGHFSRFSTDKMLNFLKRLEHKVVIEISPHQQGEPYHQIAWSG